ncbi:hypothetical protein B0A52_10074 [Exophiala mesophila]|uniref:FZ domain-containing protein n=1 Tax=Exophiala mesophila TaxID=212818 RepID=A0A438MSL1_EXOME|nr:hypothetical protein B0A52_10074 [Exophiala mesophila]
MPFPKLSIVQSRLVASLVATFIFLILYITLTKPHFAYALESDFGSDSDNLHRHVIFDQEEDLEDPDKEYASVRIQRRAAEGVSSLSNNAPQNKNIDIGETQNWVFTQEEVEGPHGTPGSGLPNDTLVSRAVEDLNPELKRRQSTTRVYVTLNTCLQPQSNISDSDSDDAIPPQLQMYVSLSDSNEKPGPGVNDPDQRTIQIDGGFGYFELDSDDLDGDIHVGVTAPNATGFSGIWNYEIAASNDAPFHWSSNASNLFFVDGDNHAALLITNDTTQALPNETIYKEWMELSPPPYGVFAFSQQDRPLSALRKSFCGLKNNVRVSANIDGANNQNIAEMTNRGLGGKPKEQFYINGLNATSQYWGVLAMEGNSTSSGLGVIGGGGTVWQSIAFETKTEDNCALMYNLSFCSEVAYAVPTNPDTFSPTTGAPELAALYDSYAAQMYQYFNYSLQQIPCNTTSSSQYSLARNCDDCARAYKTWLCAVTIPRCADYSNTDTWLMPRALGQPFVNGSSIADSTQFRVDQSLLASVASNSSRNPIIDDVIKPGPYKEVLPCEDLCYDLVQSCPATLGFGCPSRGAGFENSYGTRSNDSGEITCSYLGAAYYLSRASRQVLLGQLGCLNLVLLASLVGILNLV